jgi:histidine kinase-like protein
MADMPDAGPSAARLDPGSPRADADGSLAGRRSEVRHTRFASHPEAAGRVRRFVEAVLLDWRLWHLAERAVLCASELAANAIRSRPEYGDEGFELVVALFGGTLIVEVRDGSAVLPRRSPPLAELTADDAASAANERGLWLAEAFCDRLMWCRTSTGKSVWFELTVAPRGEAPTGPRRVDADPAPGCY